ncbi:hypothetical protein NQL31_007526 [Lotmaria passim]
MRSLSDNAAGTVGTSPVATVPANRASPTADLSPTAAVADMRREVADLVAWSARVPHGLRNTAVSVDEALRRNRMEVLRTMAAMRANEEEFGGGVAPSRPLPSLTPASHLPHVGQRRTSYAHQATGRYKTIADLAVSTPMLVADDHRSSRAVLCGASPSAAAVEATCNATVVRSDPRGAVAEKHRAAVEVVKPHVPVRIERSLRNYTCSLGAVRPYGLSRHGRHEDSQLVAQPAVDSNAHYVDRMQCCRPSKGLYMYCE